MSSPDRRRPSTGGAMAVLALLVLCASVTATAPAGATGAGVTPTTKVTATTKVPATTKVLATARPWVGQMHDLGREATPAEIAAWDIDVRPDFRGLPAGQGSVADGEQIWEAKCASCHGIFGESNEVFTPLVGGTTQNDIRHGLAAGLLEGGPRTTLMKVPTISTLWDYIHRAMPWNAPRTLKADEVYATLAYMLSLGGIVDDGFVLSDRNIAEIQERMPNRDGMTKRHGLWAVDGTPDVQAVACMKDCRPLPSGVASGGARLPEHARDAHGNLAEQQRLVGPLRGAMTTPADEPPTSFEAMRKLAAGLTPAVLAKATAPGGDAGSASAAAAGASPAGAAATAAGTAPAAAGAASPDAAALAQAAGCIACHGVATRGVGPALRDIAAKYADRADRAEYLAGKIASGGQGVWGAIPMPPQPGLSESDRVALARWLAEGAK